MFAVFQIYIVELDLQASFGISPVDTRGFTRGVVVVVVWVSGFGVKLELGVELILDLLSSWQPPPEDMLLS